MKHFLKRLTQLVFCSLFLGLTLGAADVHAAKMTLSPGWGSFGSGCDVSVNVLLNTEGEDTTAADLFLYYNASEVVLVDQNPFVPGIQVRDGDLYDAYVPSVVDEERGRIQSTAFSTGAPYNSGESAGVFATVVFRSKGNARATSFTFDYVPGSTRDSNVVGSGNVDVLSQVVHASYSFEGDYCGDQTPPRVIKRQPNAGALGVSLDSNIRLRVVDNGSGVDLETVRIQVGDVEYVPVSPEVSYKGDPLEFLFTVDPKKNFVAGEPVIVVVDAMDLEGNVMTSDTYAFNYLAAEPFCGNNIVEEGEECEPAGSLACDENCRVIPGALRGAAPDVDMRLVFAALLVLILISASSFMWKTTLKH